MTHAAGHPAELNRESLLAECDVRPVRRSGPGGQRRNKVETGIVLRHRNTGIRVEASERRSQAENLEAAVWRLRLSLAVEVRSPRDPASIPGALWRSRCTGGRIVVNSRHAEFPSLLAEALDVLALEEGDVRRAAERLGCTPTQLVKLLKREPQAFALLNRDRLRRELPPLK